MMKNIEPVGDRKNSPPKPQPYSQAPLSFKIIVPFLGVSVSLLLFVMHTVKIGFGNSLEAGVQNQVENQAALAVRDFKSRSSQLTMQAKLLAEVIHFLRRNL